MRGSGLQGLAGMRSYSELDGLRLLRPLLPYTKQQLLQLAQQQQFSWREDGSNANIKYQRNRIRHQLLPQLEQLNPQAVKHIATTARYVQELQAWAVPLLQQQLLLLCTNSAGENVEYVHLLKEKPFNIDIVALKKSSMISTLLAELLSLLELPLHQVEEVIKLLEAQTGKQRQLGKYMFHVQQPFLLVKNRQAEVELPELQITGPGNYDFGPFVLEVEVSPASEIDLPTNQSTFIADAAAIPFPLTLRSWQPGDRLKVLGMKGKSRKVSDLLSEAKVAPELKKQWPVLLAGEELLWLPGVRRGSSGIISSKTEKSLTVEFHLEQQKGIL